MFPRVGFIVTNLEADNRAVVRFYNKAGEGGAVDQGRQGGDEADAALVPRFRANEVRLWLIVIAYAG